MRSQRVMKAILLVLLVCIGAVRTAWAGPNAGGTLILHANPSIVFTDFGGYCGQSGLSTCSEAVVSIPADPGQSRIFHAIAAFPSGGSPRLSVVTFGVQYDQERFVLTNHGHCGDSELPTDSWPDPGSGTAVEWNTARTDSLVECYWFAGYLYAPGGTDSTRFELTAHPTQAGVFADDAAPAAIDTIAGYGSLGFGMAGALPCPSGEGGMQAGGTGGGPIEIGPWEGGEGGGPMWERNCILVRLRNDLPMPPHGPVADLGISDFDALGREFGLVSVRRLLKFNDGTCAGYPGLNRMVVLRFREGTNVLDAVGRYSLLPNVIAAQPNYVFPAVGLSAHADDRGFSRQWHLLGPGATTCRDPGLDPECCAGCDIGVDVAWQYTQGDSAVRVAFIDTGLDMQHPDLIDAFVFNPGEDANHDGQPELCPLIPGGGDIDSVDADGNGIADDVVLGFAFDSLLTTWRHVPDYHGTNVAGLLAAETDNHIGTASAAGGNQDSLHVRGVGLIPFSIYHKGTTERLIETFTYAHLYHARVYSSSLNRLDLSPRVTEAVDTLSRYMLFVQAIGNGADTGMVNFASLPKVMAVGGYDGITGGRWVKPDSIGGQGPLGSSYGPKLELMGPAADDLSEESYPRMVMASTWQTHRDPDPYQCLPAWHDSLGCFGGTSAAAPIVASVAALVFSYSEQHGLGLTPDSVRKILDHTAEDILCDPLLSRCDCSNTNECVDLLGRDVYSGFGRVDAGRALTLPVAILSPLTRHVFYPGDSLSLSWEAFGSVVERETLNSGAHFELHYLVPDSTFDWHLIDGAVPASVRSYNWSIPEDFPPGRDHRIRLTVVDSLGNRNQDYSDRFQFPYGPASVESLRKLPLVLAAGPNPFGSGARIRYLLPSASDVHVQVFDVGGRLVRTVAVGREPAGLRALHWNGRDDSDRQVASGIYFVRLELGPKVKTVRLVRIR